MSRLRPAILLVAFISFTLPLMPLQQLFKWFWPSAARRFPHWYHRQLARLLGFKVTVEGSLPNASGILIVANHVSWADIVILSAVAPVQFVAKKEVAGWPLFGSLARLQNSIFVDRTTRHSTGGEKDVITQHLNTGATIVLFPEGTSGDGRSVRQFRSSYFAVPEAIAIVPTTLSYTSCHGIPLSCRLRPRFAWYGDMDLAPHLWAALATGPIEVRVKFGEAFYVGKNGDRKHIARQSENLIRETLALTLHGRNNLG
jgi:lyso-ornithine lipid O-acyltransferase